MKNGFKKKKSHDIKIGIGIYFDVELIEALKPGSLTKVKLMLMLQN